MEQHDENQEVSELVRLSQIEHELEDGQPDMMGWPVADMSGEEVGTLGDMLVDVETGDIPFGAISYSDRCTAIPLDLMYLDEPNKRLVLPATKDQLNEAPQFTDDTEDMEPYVDYWDSIIEAWDGEPEDAG
jgi:hypothetical protein